MKRTIALLLAAAALVSACTQGSATRTIRVNLEGSRFVPDTITVDARETVRFQVFNNDPIDHEFVIGDKKTQEQHAETAHEAAEDTPGAHGGMGGMIGHESDKTIEAVDIPAGESATLEYTFSSSLGELIIGCHIDDHYETGMRGTIHIR